MTLTPEQLEHERVIDEAHRALVAATTREDRERHAAELVAAIRRRDPAVTEAMERARLARVSGAG